MIARAINGEKYVNQFPVLHFNSVETKLFPFWQSKNVVRSKNICPKNPNDIKGNMILKIEIKQFILGILFLILYDKNIINMKIK